MAVPKPTRKAATTSNDAIARPTSSNVPGASAYNRQSAAPFSNPGKGAYVRKDSGLNASNVSVNRPDEKAGKLNNPAPSTWKGNYANNSQPFNNSGKGAGQKMSSKMKGVD